MSKVKDLFRNIWLNIKGFMTKCMYFSMLVIWVCIGCMVLYIKRIYWKCILHISPEDYIIKSINFVNELYKPFGLNMNEETLKAYIRLRLWENSKKHH